MSYAALAKGSRDVFSESDIARLSDGSIVELSEPQANLLAETTGLTSQFFTSDDPEYVQAVMRDLATLRALRDAGARA